MWTQRGTRHKMGDYTLKQFSPSHTRAFYRGDYLTPEHNFSTVEEAKDACMAHLEQTTASECKAYMDMLEMEASK